MSLHSAFENVVLPANRAVEVNEMWRLRQKEKELDSRLRGSRNGSSKRRSGSDVSNTSRSTSREYYDNESHSSASSSSKKRVTRESHPSKDDGLKDDEMEEFLHARYLFACSPLHILSPSALSVHARFKLCSVLYGLVTLLDSMVYLSLIVLFSGWQDQARQG